MTGKVFALGFFDGVHAGHAALFRETVELAEALSAAPAVLSFTTHPSQLLRGQSVPLLSSVEERRVLISAVSGIEEVLLLPFDQRVQETPWDKFLSRLLAEQSLRGCVVGYDYRFGRAGAGDTDKLRCWCEEHGVECRVIPAVELEGKEISSTLIRGLLREGRAAEAVRFLGHPYLLCGNAAEHLLPHGEDHLRLKEGLYLADLAAADGTSFRGIPVLSGENGLHLPPYVPDGGVAVAVVREMNGEE